MFRNIQAFFRKITIAQWVLMVLSVMAFGTSIASWFITPLEGRNADWWTGWFQNFSTEMFGAITTFILFELIIGRSEQKQARIEQEQRQKADLIRRLRSGDLAIVRVAVDEAREQGWLGDGTLTGIDLQGANLEGINLQGGNFARTNLEGAILRHARLENSNLSEVNLTEAILDYASLMNANLIGANLYTAHLQSAKLMNTNLSGANLDGAMMVGCHLRRTTLTNATLPDGTEWTAQVDMGRFIDSDHPNFFDTEEVPF